MLAFSMVNDGQLHRLPQQTGEWQTEIDI